MRAPKVLLIDLDNTLLGSHKRQLHWSFIRAFISEARNRGLGFWSALSLLHILKKETTRIGSSQTNVERALLAIRSRYPAQFLDDLSVHTLIQTVFTRCRPQFFTLPQARPFLDWAKKRGDFRMVLATNPIWPLAVVELRLAWGGISGDEFEWITHGEVMRSAKPSLDYYRQTITHLGVDAKDCLLIGDSVTKDLPAHELGIPVFLLDTRIQEDHQKEIYVGDLQSLITRLDRAKKT